jgi:hypothetical protein
LAFIALTSSSICFLETAADPQAIRFALRDGIYPRPKIAEFASVSQ